VRAGRYCWICSFPIMNGLDVLAGDRAPSALARRSDDRADKRESERDERAELDRRVALVVEKSSLSAGDAIARLTERLATLRVGAGAGRPPMSDGILIVDDDADNREIMRRALTRAGYGIALACDGREAMDAVEREAPDLILLDLSMPASPGGRSCAG